MFHRTGRKRLRAAFQTSHPLDWIIARQVPGDWRFSDMANLSTKVHVSPHLISQITSVPTKIAVLRGKSGWIVRRGVLEQPHPQKPRTLHAAQHIGADQHEPEAQH